MIFFDHPKGGRFNFRVAGVAYANDRVLLQRVAGVDFWFLPGGRVEMLESASEALEMGWFDLRHLPSVRPGFLRQGLVHPPESTAHIVFHDTPVPLV